MIKICLEEDGLQALAVVLAAGAAAAAAYNFETAGRHLAALPVVSDLEEEPEEEQAIAVAPVSLPLAHYSPSHLKINTLSLTEVRLV